jgi:hypothetical protein
MQNTPDPIPPDVAAYLSDAAIGLATELGFTPSSELDLQQWMEEHHQTICKRASDAMWRLFNTLMQNQEMMDLAADHLGKKVYAAINAARDPDATLPLNPRFVEYCEAMGYSGFA